MEAMALAPHVPGPGARAALLLLAEGLLGNLGNAALDPALRAGSAHGQLDRACRLGLIVEA